MYALLNHLLHKIYRNSALLRRWWFWLRFVKNNRYIPNFKNPKTYNEKINFRKNDPQNPLFSFCADKIRAKEYVAAKISSNIIIPNYYTGESITLTKMRTILRENGDCFLKANHNSGPVHLLTTKSSNAEIQLAIDKTLDQLKIDYGKHANEPWYSHIQRSLLVEKRLVPEQGTASIRDYKFHMFKQADESFVILFEVHFDRDSNPSISYFDEKLNWLPITCEYPNIYTSIERPKNYEQMIQIAKTLAEPFSYVRVDLYNIDGQIYFGELTFAKTGGHGVFLDRMYDLWMGNLWQGDPRT